MALSGVYYLYFIIKNTEAQRGKITAHMLQCQARNQVCQVPSSGEGTVMGGLRGADARNGHLDVSDLDSTQG